MNKRGVLGYKEKNIKETTRWDPISKIDIIALPERKFIAYDGGSQSSYIYQFNGDFTELRNQMPENASKHFWGRTVLVSHFIKKDSGYKALIIGSAGGQEVKAALMYGAAAIDAVELVGYVVDIGKRQYAEYNGNIFNHPNVNVYTAEGRSFLRAADKQYDVIQMFSNHTSSSIAAGSGAMAPNYLQTAEAYKEYFSHLTDDGILHINHHIYPRIITTAALAWYQLGHNNFKSHVVVFEDPNGRDDLPTTLIKMSPWRKDEIDELIHFFKDTDKELVEDPFDKEPGFLPEIFYSSTRSI